MLELFITVGAFLVGFFLGMFFTLDVIDVEINVSEIKIKEREDD